MKKIYLLLTVIFFALISSKSFAQTLSKEEKKSEKIFIKNADQALETMKKTAMDMEVKGVAIVFYIPGNETQSWISKMLVVGKMTNEKANFLGIANTKAAEMAETLINSGSKIRPPKNGELGYIGGIIKKIDSGYLLATFSGAKGEEDAAISTKAIEWFVKKF